MILPFTTSFTPLPPPEFDDLENQPWRQLGGRVPPQSPRGAAAAGDYKEHNLGRRF